MFHVDRRHALKCLQDPDLKQNPNGTAQLFFLYIFPWGYPDPMDFEADAWALQQLKRLQCSPREAATFLRKMKVYADANGFGVGRAKPRSGREASLFDNHYRAHPPAYRRLKKLEALMEPAATKPK